MTARVLLIDDSAVVRGMLSKIFAEEPDLDLVGTAPNGKIGVEKALKLNPDIIVLDVEMPVMGGLEALVHLRQNHPATPIVMFSTLTAKGAETSLEALSNGASDYAMKPSNTRSSGSAVDQVKAELFVKLNALAKSAKRTPARPAARPGAVPPGGTRPFPGASGAPATAGSSSTAGRRPVKRPQRPNKRLEALVIGSSTGGPTALEQVLGTIRHPLPVPILVTQHLPPMFTKAMADRLNRSCAFPVVEAEDKMMVEAGTCYIAAGGYHMVFEEAAGGVRISLDEGPKVKSCRPSVDVMADSAREIYGDQMLAVMLTGMGDDGADAFYRLAEAGIEIIVQDEATSVIWGMPGAVHTSGASDHCLPLDQISQKVIRTVTAGRPGAAATFGALT